MYNTKIKKLIEGIKDGILTANQLHDLEEVIESGTWVRVKRETYPVKDQLKQKYNALWINFDMYEDWYVTKENCRDAQKLVDDYAKAEELKEEIENAKAEALREKRSKIYESLKAKVETSDSIEQFVYDKYIENKQSHKVFAKVEDESIDITNLCEEQEINVSRAKDSIILKIPIVTDSIWVEYDWYGSKRQRIR